MGLVDTAKHVLKKGSDDGRELEEGQSSTLPPAGQHGPPDPHFQGPGGPEFPGNGGSGNYERVGMEPARKDAEQRVYGS